VDGFARVRPGGGGLGVGFFFLGEYDRIWVQLANLLYLHHEEEKKGGVQKKGRCASPTASLCMLWSLHVDTTTRTNGAGAQGPGRGILFNSMEGRRAARAFGEAYS